MLTNEVNKNKQGGPDTIDQTSIESTLNTTVCATNTSVPLSPRPCTTAHSVREKRLTKPGFEPGTSPYPVRAR